MADIDPLTVKPLDLGVTPNFVIGLAFSHVKLERDRAPTADLI
ncbi:hypothetical protein [Scytonema millei]|nr:hypothetical protein [Scytonema millei]